MSRPEVGHRLAAPNTAALAPTDSKASHQTTVSDEHSCETVSMLPDEDPELIDKVGPSCHPDSNP